MNSKAYPPEWPYNDAMRAAARRWQRQGLLTPAQQVAIEEAHPVAYYRPNIWVRVLLFGAMLFVVGSMSMLLLLFFLDSLKGSHLNSSLSVYSGLVLVGSLLALELFISESRHYRSGVDNALLYSALLAWGFVVGTWTGSATSGSLASPTLWLWLLPVLLALLAALVRYADPVVAAASFAAAVALLANVLMQSSLGRMLLPFGVMAAAGGLLLALRRLPARPDYFYYRSAGLVLRTLGLAALYLAGNYLVVREGNAALLGGGSPSRQIPLAGLFYVSTAGIPLVYLVLALRRHDRLLLTLGALALAFSLFTLRYYHAVLPPEVAATVGGAVLLLGALAALRYLRQPRHGLTAQAAATTKPLFNLEAVLVAQTAHAPAAPAAGFEFGGGHSGGGGAEGRF